jgi:hypothetical protein
MDSNNTCVNILNVSHDDDSDDTVSCCENVEGSMTDGVIR